MDTKPVSLPIALDRATWDTWCELLYDRLKDHPAAQAVIREFRDASNNTRGEIVATERADAPRQLDLFEPPPPVTRDAP